MELQNDWKIFKQLWNFNLASDIPHEEHAIYCVIDGEWIIDASSRNQDLSEWVGAPIQEFAREFSNRKLFTVQLSDIAKFSEQGWTRSQFNLTNVEATSGAGLLEQNSTKKPRRSSFQIDLGFKSFLEELFSGRMKRFLPRHFGLFITLTDGEVVNGYFVSFKNGELEICMAPSFPPTVENKGRFLAEKYLIPVVSVDCHALDWKKWNLMPNPWKEMRQAFKDGKLRVSHGSKWVGRVLFAKATLGI